MEFINKIELQGIVGYVSTYKVGDTTVARFSVATENTYTSKDGAITVDTTWHSCTAWESAKNAVSDLKRGSPVHLVGRVRNTRYTTADGWEKTVSEIVVNEVKVLPTSV